MGCVKSVAGVVQFSAPGGISNEVCTPSRFFVRGGGGIHVLKVKSYAVE